MYWTTISHKAWQDVLSVSGTKPVYTVLFLAGVFALSQFGLHKVFGKETVKKKLIEAGIGLAALVLMGLLAFIFCLFFVAPSQVFEEQKAELQKNATTLQAATSKLQAKLDAKPTPVKDKCLNLTKMLTDAADAWDAQIAQQKGDANASSPANRQFWVGTMTEFGDLIISVRHDLLEHGQRAVILDEVGNGQMVMMAFNQPKDVAYLRQLISEIKRMAMQLNE